MDIEKILQDIASKFNKTVEEIRDSNIDDIFQDEPERGTGEVTPIYSLADYIVAHLPNGYNVEIDDKDDGVYAIVDINLRKKLIDEGKDMGEGIFVKHKNDLIVEIITLDAERGFDEPGFKKIGDILSKFKQAYDMIEAYQDDKAGWIYGVELTSMVNTTHSGSPRASIQFHVTPKVAEHPDLVISEEFTHGISRLAYVGFPLQPEECDIDKSGQVIRFNIPELEKRKPDLIRQLNECGVRDNGFGLDGKVAENIQIYKVG